MREILKRARQGKNMTQQAMAEHLNINLRHYKKIESGETLGSIILWDSMEDLFSIHQRKLREISDNRHDRVKNP